MGLRPHGARLEAMTHAHAVREKNIKSATAHSYPQSSRRLNVGYCFHMANFA